MCCEFLILSLLSPVTIINNNNIITGFPGTMGSLNMYSMFMESVSLHIETIITERLNENKMTHLNDEVGPGQ